MKKSDIVKWHPTIIKRVEKNNISSSTTPVLILTDQGEGYFKVLGNKEGPHVLACEYVGTSLAALLGLATFEYCLFYFSGEPEIVLPNNFKAKPGTGFLTKAESGSTWDGTKEILRNITNQDDITKLVCLDTWVRNQDRYFPSNDNKKSRRNFDNVFLSNESKNGLTLKVFDFTHAFTNGRDVTTKINQNIRDPAVYGLFPEFQDYLDKEIATKISRKLKTIKEEQIRSIINKIPREWEIDKSVREKWGDFIINRAKYLSKNFLTSAGLKEHSQQQQFLFD